jgi:putative tricarboxylic transport membrane protein
MDKRNLGDIIGSLLFMSVGIGVTIGAIGLHVGKATEPQPGFFPFLGGIALSVLSGILLLQAWRGRSAGTQVFGKLWGPCILFMVLIFYVATLETLGYLICTAILSAVILRVMETKSLRVLIMTSILVAVGSYILFNRLLDVPLPLGILVKLL